MFKSCIGIGGFFTSLLSCVLNFVEWKNRLELISHESLYCGPCNSMLITKLQSAICCYSYNPCKSQNLNVFVFWQDFIKPHLPISCSSPWWKNCSHSENWQMVSAMGTDTGGVWLGENIKRDCTTSCTWRMLWKSGVRIKIWIGKPETSQKNVRLCLYFLYLLCLFKSDIILLSLKVTILLNCHWE